MVAVVEQMLGKPVQIATVKARTGQQKPEEENGSRGQANAWENRSDSNIGSKDWPNYMDEKSDGGGREDRSDIINRSKN